MTYDSSFWDERYSSEGYMYGLRPNTFLAEHYNILGSPVLSLAEGEGRNAVYLASKGFKVVGVDYSRVALEKARQLAESNSVEIETVCADLGAFQPEEESYGSVISISAHLPSAVRSKLYPLVEKCLKPGGILLLEAYTEAQLQYDTGGPKEADRLMSIEKLTQEFPNLEPLFMRELEREVIEGWGHKGTGAVVQFIARRNLRVTPSED